MPTTQVLSAMDPLISNAGNLLAPSGPNPPARSSHNDQHLSVTLDDRGALICWLYDFILFNIKSADNINCSIEFTDLWMRFQNLTNEMIVTKNGRYVNIL